MNAPIHKRKKDHESKFQKELKEALVKKSKKDSSLEKDENKKSVKKSNRTKIKNRKKRGFKDKSKLLKAQQTPVEYMAFSGGGASGAMYSGVRDALEESGKMKEIKAVAGSSAGAITASLIATGISREDFQKLSAETNFQQLVDSKRKKLWGNDGKPLYELIQRSIEKNFINLMEEDIESLCTKRLEELEKERSQLPQEENKNKKRKQDLEERISEIEKSMGESKVSRLKKISLRKNLLKNKNQLEKIDDNLKYIDYQKQQLTNQEKTLNEILEGKSVEFKSLIEKKAMIKERLAKEEISGQSIAPKDNEKILFKDISLMRVIDPTRFKDLVVTAVNKKSGELEIFSPATTPDTEVAIACKASASIPLYFKSTKIDGKKYVDGGYRDNIPTKYFEDDSMPEYIKQIKDKKMMSKARTMAFAFSSNNPGDTVQKAIYGSQKRIYKPKAIVKFLADTVLKKLAKVGGKFKYSDDEEKTAQSLRENALNVIPLDRSDVTALSFKEATREAKFLHHRGYVDTMNHMCNHELAQENNQEVQTKDFLLNFYKSINKKTSKLPWKEKIDENGRDYTKSIILSICDKREQEHQALDMEKLIESASAKSGKIILSENTQMMEKLIKHLNKPNTPLSIKKSVMGVIGIDPEDSRLKAESGAKNLNSKDEALMYNKAVANFKFKKEDFKEKLIDLSKQRAEKSKGMSNLHSK